MSELAQKIKVSTRTIERIENMEKNVSMKIKIKVKNSLKIAIT